MAYRRALPRLTIAALVLVLTPRAMAAVGDITLVGQLSFPTANRITNVWGYYDWTTATEYALVGDWTTGFYIVDVSDPSNPVEVKKVTSVPAFDLKPWGHYVYSCDGNTIGKDSRITDISDVNNPIVLPTTFQSCHTISISTGGIMYLEAPGVWIFDLLNDPTSPDSLYRIGTGGGHDSTPRGQRLYDFNGGFLNIWDVSNPASPTLIGGNDDPTISYYHGGDESKDRNYLYVCDELSASPSADIIVFDIANPALPLRGVSINDATSTVHQLYVVGDLMFVGYYNSGFKVFDITNPAIPVLADQYDTSAYQAEQNYNGAYNAYPFAPSGIVYVSDHPTGLWLFSVEGHAGTTTGVGGPPRTGGAVLAQNYPNPFNPSTTIEYEILRPGRVRLSVFDASGARVRTLVDSPLPAGLHRATWDGRDEGGRAVASGVYYYQLTAGAAKAARRMVLLK